MIAPMTKESEARIISALNDVAAAADSGEHPNAILAKAAAAHRIPPGHVRILAQAYNTARSLEQHEADATLEKAAAFPLADADAILATLYPRQPKSAAAIERDSAVSSDYDAPPRWYHDAATKAARASTQGPIYTKSPNAPALPSLPDKRLQVAYKRATAAFKPLEDLEAEISRLTDGLDIGLRKLAGYFRTIDAIPFADVRANATRLYGKAAANLFVMLEGMDSQLKKQASTQPFHRVDERSRPYSEVSVLISTARQLRDKRAEHRSTGIKAAKLVQADGEIKVAAGVLAAPQRDPLKIPKQIGIAALVATGAQGLRDLGSHLAIPKDALKDKAMAAIASPEHEQQLRDIQIQAMLQDLLANDPIVSSYDPLAVTHAFNELSQLAPRTAAQPALLAPLLRKHLQLGVLDSFEGAQVAGTEHKLREIATPLTGGGNAKR